MGEPVGEQYPPGDDATVCWGIGKTFGVGSTPYQVFLTWSGLLPPRVGANKKFTATQDPITPGKWNCNDGVYEGWWLFDVAQTIAQIKIIGEPFAVTGFGGLCALTCVAPFGAGCVIS